MEYISFLNFAGKLNVYDTMMISNFVGMLLEYLKARKNELNFII